MVKLVFFPQCDEIHASDGGTVIRLGCYIPIPFRDNRRKDAVTDALSQIRTIMLYIILHAFKHAHIRGSNHFIKSKFPRRV